jgi:hypothetical protein
MIVLLINSMMKKALFSNILPLNYSIIINIFNEQDLFPALA